MCLSHHRIRATGTREPGLPGTPSTIIRHPFEEVLESSTTVSLRVRSEEHTSKLQSRLHLVCRLLLEKKKRARPTNVNGSSRDLTRANIHNRVIGHSCTTISYLNHHIVISHVTVNCQLITPANATSTY